MEPVTFKALVVESGLASRRELVQTLRETGIITEVLEAQSVNDGLSSLSAAEIDTCLLGPMLSVPVAANFVKQGISLLRTPDSKHKPCAFVAVRPDGGPIPPELIDVGVVDVLAKPYNAKTFSETVQRAVTIATEQWDTLGKLPDISPIARAANVPYLSDVLAEISGRLRIVAQDLRRGRLSTSIDGRPSLATKDALRMAIEAALPEGMYASQLGTYDNLFVLALVEWFSDRVNLEHSRATANLRQKLVSYAAMTQKNGAA